MPIMLKQDPWGRDYELQLTLPAHWNIEVLHMNGHSKSMLSNHQYREALAPLEENLREKKEICILFDDLSRPTKAYEILPHLFELFEKCGIRDDQVRLICALGTHRPVDNIAFRKKLGTETMERFPVFNHNPYENCRHIGDTNLGTPVIVNKEYLSCDMKIAIGSILPHSFCGFGGGYKIVMPGVSHIDSIEYHHGKLLNRYRDSVCTIGKYGANPLLDDLKEAGKMTGLDIIINVLVNEKAESVDIYAGDPEDVYGFIADRGASHYSTAFQQKADIVFANAYAKANEATIALSLAEMLLKDDKEGYIVLLCDIEEGQALHYLFGRFGKESWGRLGYGERAKNKKVKKIFIYSRHGDKANNFWFGKNDEIIWSKSITDIIKSLEEEFRGRKPDVLVIPDGTIQTLKT